MLRFILFGMFLITMTSASAAERFLLEFELTKGESSIESGKVFITQKQRTWSKGLQRSYLRLRCQPEVSGEVKKLYSTVDHFAGLRITHQLAGDNIALTVVRSLVQPRLTEIRALARSECKDMSPIVTTTTQSYSIFAKDGDSASRPFGEQMAFRIRLQSIDGKR